MSVAVARVIRVIGYFNPWCQPNVLHSNRTLDSEKETLINKVIKFTRVPSVPTNKVSKDALIKV